jgi:hypothetical protein
MRIFRALIGIACLIAFPLVAFADEPAAAGEKPVPLRLLDTSVFGKRTTDSIVLLEPPRPGALDPETVMVDIDKGQYYAATVSYPKEISFEAARQALNSVYGKWEVEYFAKDPEMGMWRNEDDKFSIQMTENAFALAVIYIKFSMLPEEKFLRGFSRAGRLVEDEEQANQKVTAMLGLLENGDFAEIYRTHCHKHVRDQMSEREFNDFMQSDQGKKVVELFRAVVDAIGQGKGNDTLFAQFNERDIKQFEFVLVKERQAGGGRLWHLELQKEDGAWRLMDFD